MTIKTEEEMRHKVRKDIALMQIAEQRAKRNIQLRLGVILSLFWKRLVTDVEYFNEFKKEYDMIK